MGNAVPLFLTECAHARFRITIRVLLESWFDHALFANTLQYPGRAQRLIVNAGSIERSPLLKRVTIHRGEELLNLFLDWNEQPHLVAVPAQVHPGLFPHFLERVRAQVQDKLISLLGLIARQSLEKEDVPDQSARKRSVSVACDFLTSFSTGNARMSDLCRIAGVSERSLQYAFKEELGLTARDFMTMRRLHAARRSLRLADPALSSVSDIAMEHGFFELGRFAGKYRAFFGELPSETLGK